MDFVKKHELQNISDKVEFLEKLVCTKMKNLNISNNSMIEQEVVL